MHVRRSKFDGLSSSYAIALEASVAVRAWAPRSGGGVSIAVVKGRVTGFVATVSVSVTVDFIKRSKTAGEAKLQSSGVFRDYPVQVGVIHFP